MNRPTNAQLVAQRDLLARLLHDARHELIKLGATSPGAQRVIRESWPALAGERQRRAGVAKRERQQREKGQ